MTSDQEGFKKALKENPYDEVAHRAYADWLDEHGYEEDSLVHREWSALRHRESQAWLEDFVKKVNEAYGWHRDEQNEYDFIDPPYHIDLITYGQLLEVAGECLKGDYRGGFTLPFDVPGFVYKDKEQFWRHVATVLWVTIPGFDTLMMPFRHVHR